jgi:hypothetical protein
MVPPLPVLLDEELELVGDPDVELVLDDPVPGVLVVDFVAVTVLDVVTVLVVVTTPPSASVLVPVTTVVPVETEVLADPVSDPLSPGDSVVLPHAASAATAAMPKAEVRSAKNELMD